jgi:hypothetical protein
MAKASLFLGISAALCMLIPSFTLFLVIPLGIQAILYGKMALKNGTTKPSMAESGKSMGIYMLILLSIEIVLAGILIAIR